MDIIESRHGVFWANVFSVIKHLDLSEDTMKISLIFKSLKTYGAKSMKENLDSVVMYL